MWFGLLMQQPKVTMTFYMPQLSFESIAFHMLEFNRAVFFPSSWTLLSLFLPYRNITETLSKHYRTSWPTLSKGKALFMLAPCFFLATPFLQMPLEFYKCSNWSALIPFRHHTCRKDRRSLPHGSQKSYRLHVAQCRRCQYH